MSMSPNAVSGFWTYRVAYPRRSAPPVSGTAPEGDMAAMLLVPEKPIAGAPLVVFGARLGRHRAQVRAVEVRPVGPGAATRTCPPSLYKLAGYGFTVIAPDYAGFSYGQAPGYFNAEDEAHAILDATRAAAKLLPSPPSKVVFVGHSQGGHAALVGAQLREVVRHAAARSSAWRRWRRCGRRCRPGARSRRPPPASRPRPTSTTILYSMEYFYSAGELRDGPGGGLEVFQTAKRQAVKDTLLGGECYENAKLQALGATPADFFDPTFVSDVGFDCAANPFGSDCTQG